MELGTFHDRGPDTLVIDRSCKVEAGGKLVGMLLKGVVSDPALVAVGRGLVRYKDVTPNRRDAAGKGVRYLKSLMVGYVGRDRFGPCRRSHYYRRDATWFDDNVVSLAQSVSAAFQRFCPDSFLEHSRFAAGLNPNLVIPGAVFTTITVNVDARTALHTDTGNFGKIGCMAVFGMSFRGCDLLVPGHDLAFVVEEGDLLIST
jgi:hypothetical protein